MTKTKSNLYPGEIIYVYEFWTDQIYMAHFLEYQDNNDQLVKFEYSYPVNRDGEVNKKVGELRGTGVREYNNFWLTVDDAYQFLDTQKDEIVDTYLENINSVEDLLNFPLNHSFSGEYTNNEAIKAYKIKVKELLGYTL